MRLVILYHPRSDHAHAVESYARTFEQTRRKKIELISLDSRTGAETARLYDIVQYPVLLALAEDGQLLKDWQGEYLPLMDEVAAYSD